MNLLKYVNIDVGTASEYRESFGNTLPLTQYPLGNQGYLLQTNKQKGGWFYQPQSNYTEGIRISNQPSPWLGDYGHITLLPFVGDFNVDMHSSLTSIIKAPNMLSGRLNRFETEFKLIPSQLGAKLCIENKSQLRSKLQIDCHNGLTEYQIDKNKIFITNRNLEAGQWSKSFRKFYCLKFNCNIINIKTYSRLKPIKLKKCNEMVIEIELEDNNYSIDLTSSYISIEQVERTCDQLSTVNLNDAFSDVTNAWNRFLNTIQLDSNVEEKTKHIFYSNLYRLFCYPRFISEICEDGKEKFYCFKDKEIKIGSMITDIGFWDVYRTSFPLIELLAPSIYQKILNAIINYYDAYGWLPRWLAPYERGIMPSTLVDSVVSKAIVDGKLPPSAIESVVQNATKIDGDTLFGRDQLESYLQYGYIPYDISNESVSKSLDNYYCDYAIFKAMERIGDKRADSFRGRAGNYKYLFNVEYKSFVSKDRFNEFKPKFNVYEWGTDFCESSAVQNCFNVVHDVENVIELYGGHQAVDKRLNELFSELPKYDTGRYGFEIHEMTEYARSQKLGHFAISNQPSFILPFWYLKIGQEEKFYSLIEETLQYFQNTEYGYPGDEDNGSLAAWYIWVNIGMYPFCPVDSILKFKPQFEYNLSPL